jgi:hypothetical protein
MWPAEVSTSQSVFMKTAWTLSLTANKHMKYAEKISKHVLCDTKHRPYQVYSLLLKCHTVSWYRCKCNFIYPLNPFNSFYSDSSTFLTAPILLSLYMQAAPYRNSCTNMSFSYLGCSSYHSFSST